MRLGLLRVQYIAGGIEFDKASINYNWSCYERRSPVLRNCFNARLARGPQFMFAMKGQVGK